MVAIPQRILDNWGEWFGPRSSEIAEQVESRAGAAIEEWNLQQPRLMEGGEVALVLEAVRDGAPVVCKLSPPDPMLGEEARALAAWDGVCPELLGTRDEETTILMERLRPGTSLGDSGAPVAEQLRVIGEAARCIHLAPAPDVPRLAGTELAREWAESLEDDGDRAELAELLDAGDVVIHTDLHGYNVLRHGDEWRVIDPKPFRAMPEAEIWGLIDETDLTPGREREQMAERLEVYCAAASLDRELARRWARIRAIAEAGSLTERQSGWRGELLRVAEALR